MKKWLLQYGVIVFTLAIALLILWPLVLMLSLSIWRSADVLRLYQHRIPHVTFIPPVVSFEQFVLVIFEHPSYLNMFFNSLVLSMGISIGAVVVDFFAGYVLSKIRFRGCGIIYGAYVFMMLLPPQVTLLAVYIASRTLGLINSWWSIVLPGTYVAAHGTGSGGDHRPGVAGRKRCYSDEPGCPGAGNETAVAHGGGIYRASPGRRRRSIL